MIAMLELAMKRIEINGSLIERIAVLNLIGQAVPLGGGAAGRCAGEMEALQGTIRGGYLEYWPEVAGTAELMIRV